MISIYLLVSAEMIVEEVEEMKAEEMDVETDAEMKVEEMKVEETAAAKVALGKTEALEKRGIHVDINRIRTWNHIL